MSESEYIVEFRNITKRFPGIVANRDVSFGVKKGEIFAILGENGAGKSTLMSMLFGMYEPDEGEIYVRGEKVDIKSPTQATALSIGMVHQHFKLVENFTITENIILGMEPQKKMFGFLPTVDVKGTNEKIRALSKKYGLEVNPEELIEDIKVSTRQRVEILKMLYREAEILIFDEPTAMLTPQETGFLLEIIKGLRDDGKTVILITHKLDEIKLVADRAVVLRRGELVSHLDVRETSTQEMANQMVGKDVPLSITKSKANVGKPMLEVRNLTVENEDGFEVVSDVSFTVSAGEIFAIAGVSGNGQVEITDAIAGLIPIKSGQIFLDGEEITHFSVRKRTEAGLAYIPEDRQTYGMILDFSLEENLALKSYYKAPYAKSGVLQRNVFRDEANAMISEYDIRSGQGPATVVRSMSGGNQQKAIVAREISLGTKATIFFQPTRGLDIGAINNIHCRMVEERDKGKAVLLVSLELEEVMTCADRIGILYSGCMNRTALSDEISKTEIGEYMMGVRRE